MPPSSEQLQLASAMIERALATNSAPDRVYALYFLFSKSLAEYRAGHIEAALAALKGRAAGVVGPAPGLVIATIWYRLGQVNQFIQTMVGVLGSRIIAQASRKRGKVKLHQDVIAVPGLVLIA